jgi:hypothetical protein
MKSTKKKFLVSNLVWIRREFDPSSPEDLIVYKKFLDESAWKNGCPFIVEWPYLTVPDTIQNKILNHHLGGIIKTVKS